jgi:hypothetical protein
MGVWPGLTTTRKTRGPPNLSTRTRSSGRHLLLRRDLQGGPDGSDSVGSPDQGLEPGGVGAVVHVYKDGQA